MYHNAIFNDVILAVHPSAEVSIEVACATSIERPLPLFVNYIEIEWD